tara:strand:- start:727 stop:1869 length:1143 start_codon:yes stop_codon:yes gene_type:complete
VATNLVNSLIDPELAKNIFGSEQGTEDISFADSVRLGEKFGKKMTARKRSGHRFAMTYPITQGPKEVTGDRLLIKCFKYRPSETGLSERKDKGVVGIKGEDTLLTDSNNKIVTGEIKAFDFINRGGAADKSQSIFYISLPIPQEINDSNAIVWGDDSMNIFQLAGLNVARSMLAGGVDSKGNKIDFPEAVSTISRSFLSGEGTGIDPKTTNALISAISGKAINAIGGNLNINSVIARSEGLALNNNLELLFNGVTLRTFPFNVTFTPRSQKEAQVVLEIIRALKSAMAAKKNATQGQGGIFLRSPDVFTLRYLHNGKDHPFLNRIKDCALTAMNVNYTGAGTYASYFDGTPVSINMSMTFKELNPVYHEDYSDAIGGVGY